MGIKMEMVLVDFSLREIERLRKDLGTDKMQVDMKAILKKYGEMKTERLAIFERLEKLEEYAADVEKSFDSFDERLENYAVRVKESFESRDRRLETLEEVLAKMIKEE